MGSVSELETQFEISFRLRLLVSIDKEKETINRLRKMLVSLITTIHKKIEPTQK